MRVTVEQGDVLETAADILISSANPWLNMSDGVNGAILQRCPEIQEELRTQLGKLGVQAVPATSVAITSAGNLPFDHIIHAVAIDPFYDSSKQILSDILQAAFKLAELHKAKSVSLPTLATGYGPMTIEDFVVVFADIVVGKFSIPKVKLVLRTEENVATVRSILTGNSGSS